MIMKMSYIHQATRYSRAHLLQWIWFFVRRGQPLPWQCLSWTNSLRLFLLLPRGKKIVYSAGAKCGFVPSLIGDFCWSILRKPFALGCHLPEYSAKITTLRLTLRSFHRRIHIYIYTYIHIYIYTYIHIYIYTYIHIYMCVQLYAFICVYDMDQKNIWIFQSSLLNE